jgi:transposase
MKHRENILKLRNEGKSYRQIQEILACSKGTIAYHLGSGQKEKTHKRTRDLRSANTKRLRELKENIGCVDCKEMYPHYEKLGIVTNIARRYSWEKALEEVKKCDIVCANCHNIRTWNRQQG